MVHSVPPSLSLSLSLSLPPSAAWSMECADFPWPSSSLVRSSLLFHSIGEMSDTIQIAATLPPTGTGRRRERERRRRRGEEGADTFFTVLFYAKRDFQTIHSFFWPVRQPASIRSPPAHNGGRSGRPAEERRAGQCNFMLFTEWRFKVDLAKWDGCSDNFIVMAYLVIDFVMGWVLLSLRHA